MQPRDAFGHEPVLHSEVLEILAPAPGESVLDCTLGLGGHALSFLNATAPNGRLIGLDADPENLARAKERLDSSAHRIDLRVMNFRDAATCNEPVDIVFADLGVSSPHFDDPGRGFTFRADAPLDMRYDRSQGMTAASFLQSASEDAITQALKEFAEIQRSRILAQELHKRFTGETKSWTTTDVVQCVEKVFTYRAPKVLPQVFQALRIVVNDEMGALQSLLAALPGMLRPGGRCGIISYHSLEDRLVKHAFRSLSTPEKDPHTGQESVPAPFVLLTKKPIVPSSAEVDRNPRARSAHFRAIRHRPL